MVKACVTPEGFRELVSACLSVAEMGFQARSRRPGSPCPPVADSGGAAGGSPSSH